VSSQNLVLFPSPTTNDPLLKKASLTPIFSYKKGESVGFMVTCDKVLFWRYLMYNNSYHTHSSFKSLYSHLLNKILFFNSRTSTLNPLGLLGGRLYSTWSTNIFFLAHHSARKSEIYKSLTISLPLLVFQ
jgi:hypothetical protein